MKKLLIAGWIVFALDLAILLLMVRALATAELSDDDRDYAVSVTWTFGLWVCAVNAALLVGWWRDSRTVLWIALVGGGAAAVVGLDAGDRGDQRRGERPVSDRVMRSC